MTDEIAVTEMGGMDDDAGDDELIARAMLRVEVAKLVLPALITTLAGRGVDTERLIDSAFHTAELFVAKAFGDPAPAVGDPEQGT